MAQVSVIIPTHNRKHTLVRALISVVQQTWQDFDLWLIDDGSTDGTREMFLEWAEVNGEIHRFHYVYQENKGVSSARNHGVHLSQAPLLAFLDSDDEWLPHKLEIQMAQYETTGYRLIHGEEIWWRDGKKVHPKKKYAKQGGRIFTNCLPVCAISPSTTLLERSLFEEVGGFREDFPVCEDYDLWLKICSRYDVGFIEHALINKYGGEKDQLSTKFKAMDYYRVCALREQWQSPRLQKTEQKALEVVLKEKCEILLAGYKKHGNKERLKEIAALKKELAL